MRELREATQEYVDAFGKEPNIIGMLFDDPERVASNLRDAIKTGEEYDEYLMLSESDRKKFDEGMLLF
jgi:hypothetical protein